MDKKEISRRSFLKGAAAGAAGIAAVSVLGVSAFAGDEADAVSGASVAAEENEFGQQVVRVLDGDGVTRITDTLYSTGTWRLKQEPVASSSRTNPARAARSVFVKNADLTMHLVKGISCKI